MLEKINFIEAVTERDMDLLLLEELTVSPEFQIWFFNRLDIKDIKIIGVWHSISDKRYGESDIIVIFTTNDGLKQGLLIENKIDATAQENQYERYKKRGEGGIENRDWDKFLICIVAPKLYLDTNKEAQKYDNHISYEQILERFVSNKNQRNSFKAKIIKEAIEQNRRGYVVKPDEKVTLFWNSYFSFAGANYPMLEMPEPGIKPSNSDWPDFRPKILKKKMNIMHKLSGGVVDLQVFGMGDRLDEFNSKVSTILSDNIELVKASKSAALRITVPVVDRFSSFDEQKESINQGLIAAQKLLNIGISLLTKV